MQGERNASRAKAKMRRWQITQLMNHYRRWNGRTATHTIRKANLNQNLNMEHMNANYTLRKYAGKHVAIQNVDGTQLNLLCEAKTHGEELMPVVKCIQFMIYMLSQEKKRRNKRVLCSSLCLSKNLKMYRTLLILTGVGEQNV